MVGQRTLAGAALVMAVAAAQAFAAGGASANGGRTSSTLGATRSAGGAAAHMVVTPNWSGYVAMSPRRRSPSGDPYAPYNRYFKSVTGTWTVPVARCKGAKSAQSSTVWVGLGGYHTGDQEEVGTDSNCTAAGKPHYYAWFELVPYPSYEAFPQVTDRIYPGDTITGLVRVLSDALVQLRLHDTTRGWTFMRKITYSSQDTSTADWVVEAPAECIHYFCHRSNLTNFGKVTMRDISATARGGDGTLTNRRWKVVPVRLVPSKSTVPTILPSPSISTQGLKIRKGKAQSPAGSTPGPVSRDGRSFTFRWVKVATRGV